MTEVSGSPWLSMSTVPERSAEGGCSHAHPHLSRLRCRIGQFVVGTWSAIAVVSERSHELTPWRSCLKGSTVFNLELISARSRLCCRVNWRQRRPWKEL